MSQPEIVFRHGSCSASVFMHERREGKPVRTVSFQRRFRDRSGEWQSSPSLHVNDIPKAVLVLQKSYEYLTANGSAE